MEVRRLPRKPPSQLKIDKATQRAFVRWNGRKIYFGKAGSDEAAVAFAKWLMEVHSTPVDISTPSRITIAEAVQHYLFHAIGYYSQDGVPTGEYNCIRQSMQLLLSHAGGPSDLACEFGPRKLIAIQQAMASEMEGGSRKYARSTINGRIHRIKRCFRWLASQEIVDAKIPTALAMVSGVPAGRGMARETDKIPPVPVAVVSETIRHLSPTVSAMIRVQLLCGMRPQDVCRMTTGSLEMSGDIWMYRPPRHKNAYRGQSLTKAVPVAAQEIIRPLLRSDPHEPIFAACDSAAYWRTTFTTKPPKAGPPPKRKPYSTSSYGRAIDYAVARANKQKPSDQQLPKWNPNQLRHLAASEIRSSHNLEAAQLFLGHAKPDATLIYAEASESKLAEIARSLPASMASLISPK